MTQEPQQAVIEGEWKTGLGGTVAALAAAGLLAWAGSQHGAQAFGLPVFLLCGVFSYVVNWLVFAHAWATHSERFFDLTGSIVYVVMVCSALVLSGASDIRALALAGCIVVWAARLGPFLFLRIKQAGDDRRFRKLKYSFPMFLMTWTLQGTWVFITASCALAAITAGVTLPIGIQFFLGFAMWIVGFVIEIVADGQKSRFRAEPANQGSFITSGLWAWSRHPNYFGEIVLWTGIAVMAAPVLVGAQHVTLIAPLFVVLLLTRISGIPLLERRAKQRWGDDERFQAYMRNTPAVMLWPPSSNAD